jgi:hypothetical protein
MTHGLFRHDVTKGRIRSSASTGYLVHHAFRDTYCCAYSVAVSISFYLWSRETNNSVDPVDEIHGWEYTKVTNEKLFQSGVDIHNQ